MSNDITKNIVSDKILLCSSKKYSLWYKNNNLYYSDSTDEKSRYLTSLNKLRMKYFRLSNFRIFQRLLRLVPRCGIFIDDTVALISLRGYVIAVNIKNKTIEIGHKYRQGMNNPLSFTFVADMANFDEGVYYGEYFGNGNREEVKIFRRLRDGKWETAYVYPPNTIKHIHNIVCDKLNNCVYVLTGDDDEQSGIWRFRNNFCTVETIKIGSQQYRACFGYPFKQGFFYVTDTPLENNYIYYIKDFDKDPIPLAEIEGPCIYGARISENLFAFSTSVEPDSRLKGWKYRLSYKRGKGVKSWHSCIYLGNPEIGFKEVGYGQKDWLPMLLFGFGTFLFPNLDNSYNDGSIVYLVGNSICKTDGKTMKINTL